MATKEEHFEKAHRNHIFARSLNLDNQTNLEWAFVALFYSGVHYVEAYCEKMHVHSHRHGSHTKREKLMALDSQLSEVYREYLDLKNFSILARYYCRPMTVSDFEEVALPAHETIRTKIQSIL